MSRKNVLPYFKMLNAQSLGADFNTFSTPTNLNFQDKLSILLNWTGTSPVGVFEVYVSNDAPDDITRLPVNWTKLDFGNIINISGDSGDHGIHISSDGSFSWIALKYVYTSGVGSITATSTIKTVGA